MTWNHRIVRNGDMLHFAEVTYNESGVPYMWNQPFTCGDDLDEMKVIAARLRDACDLPVLDADSMENCSNLEVV